MQNKLLKFLIVKKFLFHIQQKEFNCPKKKVKFYVFYREKTGVAPARAGQTNRGGEKQAEASTLLFVILLILLLFQLLIQLIIQLLQRLATPQEEDQGSQVEGEEEAEA